MLLCEDGADKRTSLFRVLLIAEFSPTVKRSLALSSTYAAHPIQRPLSLSIHLNGFDYPFAVVQS